MINWLVNPDLQTLMSYSSLISIGFTAIGFVYRFIIKPQHEFRVSVITNIQNIHDKFSEIDTELKTLTERTQLQITASDRTADHATALIKKDVDMLKESLDTLRDHLMKFMTTSEDKSNKVLDTLLAYFKDRD